MLVCFLTWLHVILTDQNILHEASNDHEMKHQHIRQNDGTTYDRADPSIPMNYFIVHYGVSTRNQYSGDKMLTDETSNIVSIILNAEQFYISTTDRLL